MPKSPSKSPAKSASKSPSTPKSTSPKSRRTWRSPITAPSTTPLAAPNGPSIKRTEATVKYKIKATDLDTITPISKQPNHMGGSAPIQVYNECDVAALAQRVRPGKPLPEMGSSSTGPLLLAKKNGRRIMRTTAMNEFNLKPHQMDQLTPISITPNAYGTLTKYYNRCDVENLKERLGELRAASSNHHDFDPNIFDGLSPDDAAALLAQPTHP
ncbi:hypothetical protein C8R44DRAFT_784553 [Mycena epipterygia]|nr:hypothetical protein C8R44DRAFT_784553 [Mycena epipterygia]